MKGALRNDSWENLEGWKVARCMKVKYRRKTHCSMLADHTGQIYPENKTKKTLHFVKLESQPRNRGGKEFLAELFCLDLYFLIDYVKGFSHIY